ncbi:hypothetical protein [Kitasatospora brasiliensis]|nr:hypothetical protein [Kitasatospora sp. K002]
MVRLDPGERAPRAQATISGVFQNTTPSGWGRGSDQAMNGSAG